MLLVRRILLVPTEGDLKDAMKLFGFSHRDKHDAVTGMSCMFVFSDLPEEEGVDPGRFHFLNFGFYVSLDDGYTFFFSGLHQHGGTAPLAWPASL